MRPWILGVAVFVACASSAGTRFPELQPCGEAPIGYSQSFHDGPDFYIWRIAPADGSTRRGGAGLYFGHHPDRKAAPDAVESPGDLVRQATSWRIWRSSGVEHADAVVRYQHSAEYHPITLHGWVYAPDSAEVEVLESWLSSLALCQRDAA